MKYIFAYLLIGIFLMYIRWHQKPEAHWLIVTLGVLFWPIAIPGLIEGE